MKLNEVAEIREGYFFNFVHCCSDFITFAKNMRSQRNLCMIYEKETLHYAGRKDLKILLPLPISLQFQLLSRRSISDPINEGSVKFVH
jgi:hypothetical protein